MRPLTFLELRPFLPLALLFKPFLPDFLVFFFLSSELEELEELLLEELELEELDEVLDELLELDFSASLLI